MIVNSQWLFHSNSYGNCNCDANCGCQFNLNSTHGFCQFVEGGKILDGHFEDTPLTGLNWAIMIKWPGEIAEGEGRSQIIIDKKANAKQREALNKILTGQVGEPGSNHFSVFASTCIEFLPTLYLPIKYKIDIAKRTASLRVDELIESTGEPLLDPFSGKPFHIALARPEGSFEFTYAEIGAGRSSVQGELAMELKGSYAQFCELHYNQKGLVYTH